MESWKPIGGDCEHCGCDAEVKTASTDGDMAYDGDSVRCTECEMPGIFVVEEDGDGWINWHDECGCQCDWCMAHPWEEPEGER